MRPLRYYIQLHFNARARMSQVKKKLGSTYEKFEKKGLQLPEQLRQRAKSKLYSANEDKDTVYHRCGA